MDRHLVAEDVSVAVARQVEIGVIGQVHNGWFIGGGGVIESQLVIVGQRVDGLGGEVAWEMFFAIRTQIG